LHFDWHWDPIYNYQALSIAGEGQEGLEAEASLGFFVQGAVILEALYLAHHQLFLDLGELIFRGL